MARVLALLAAMALSVGACGVTPTPAPTVGSPSAPGQSAPAVACAPAAASPRPASPSPWWSDRAFYEVFVRSFADSDGDGVGDLRGLTSRLDALNDGDPGTTSDLGITGLWLMPIMESPSYHGYDVVDYRRVDQEYGSNDDLRALVAAAHQRGIAVIVDFPINHTSSQHPWFVDSRNPSSPHADWYVWSDDQPAGPGWHADGDRWYFGYFGDAMPDLNLRNPQVTAEIDDVARFWLRDMGVDGFRLDAAKHLVEEGTTVENTPATHDWLRAFTASVHAASPEALVLGEVLDLSQVSASYVPGDLDMTFEFGLASGMLDAVQAGSASRLTSALADVASLEATNGFGAFLTNHDQERVASDLRGDAPQMRLAAALLLTGPGTPFLYYGEEIGMTGSKPDERIRAPMQWDATGPGTGFTTATPWEPPADDWPTVNVAAQTGDRGSLLSRYRDLIRFRGAHPALRQGSIVPVASDSDAIAATVRATSGETLLVLANLSDAAVADYALTLDAGPLCGVGAAEVVGQAVATAGVDASATAASPAISASGGFSGYRPLEALPPQSVTVIALRP